MDISICMFNGLSDNLTSNAELFADDTSFFSVVQDANTSAKELNDDLMSSLNRSNKGYVKRKKNYLELGLESFQD